MQKEEQYTGDCVTEKSKIELQVDNLAIEIESLESRITELNSKLLKVIISVPEGSIEEKDSTQSLCPLANEILVQKERIRKVNRNLDYTLENIQL